ncbi:uncharacterized protein J7T54_007625 [Emericellopsis cladophorae]|uniref:Uncharacterized protein n=1 Tax=Emericellopsis cladophorae TaxID=2686198 RepID=A0A9Q0BC33_9HYPO|nr:uncharacterized protein J7T54_007625 [Emericellopsis cladophorae]KAI6778684.1 hypothetical protein J7T54_007625 [Emericellopsis cladophorae]
MFCKRPATRGHQLFYIFAMAGVGGGCLSAGFNFAIAYAMYNTIKQPIQLLHLPNTLAGDAALSIFVQCILTCSSLRWLLFLERNPSTKLHNILQQALRGFLICVPAFLVFWPVSVGLLTMVGEKLGDDWVFERRWTPQVFKAILGGLLGLVITPVMAMFWMVRAGWDEEMEADMVVKEEC